MVPLAGFADVLRPPFSEPSISVVDGNIPLRNENGLSADSPVATNHDDSDWEFSSTYYEGTFCVVSQARPFDRNGPFFYAVKRLKPEWLSSSIGPTILKRETELGYLISHPHIVPTLDARMDADEPYLVQPWLQGKTLRELMASGRTAKPTEVIWIARQMAEALAALEEHGFCHSDVKPGNIIVSSSGHATLIDLGLARRTDEPSLPIDRAVCGTPRYMAPELADASHAADIRADLFSLGLVMLELLFGKSALISEKSSAPRVNIGQWHAFWRSLECLQTSPGPMLSKLESLLRSMTSADVAQRPKSARELVRRLIQIELALVCI